MRIWCSKQFHEKICYCHPVVATTLVTIAFKCTYYVRYTTVKWKLVSLYYGMYLTTMKLVTPFSKPYTVPQNSPTLRHQSNSKLAWEIASFYIYIITILRRKPPNPYPQGFLQIHADRYCDLCILLCMRDALIAALYVPFCPEICTEAALLEKRRCNGHPQRIFTRYPVCIQRAWMSTESYFPFKFKSLKTFKIRFLLNSGFNCASPFPV